MTHIEHYQEHYKLALARANKRLLRQYEKRLRLDPEASRSEAAVYCQFEKLSDSIQINESPSGGGPDFLCMTKAGMFFLEATCLKVKTIEDESGIRNGVLGSGSFRPISNALFHKAMSKSRQLAGGENPRVLAITTEHSLGSMLMNIGAAKTLLVGNSLITFTMSDPSSEIRLATELKDSAFYVSQDEQRVGHSLKAISAVLLMPIYGLSCHLICIVNPSPAVPFSARMLPNICIVAIEREPNSEQSVFSVTVKDRDALTSGRFWE